MRVFCLRLKSGGRANNGSDVQGNSLVWAPPSSGRVTSTNCPQPFSAQSRTKTLRQIQTDPNSRDESNVLNSRENSRGFQSLEKATLVRCWENYPPPFQKRADSLPLPFVKPRIVGGRDRYRERKSASSEPRSGKRAPTIRARAHGTRARNKPPSLDLRFSEF